MSLNTSFQSKFNEICRTCLKGGQLLTYLYDEENSINLVEKLKSCTGLQFDKNDQMPNKICPTCIEELLQAYNYINKCQISDATLKKYLLQENTVTKIEDEIASDLNETIKVEVEDDTNIDNEHFDIVSNISFKEELIDATEESDLAVHIKKRKRDECAAECSVDFSSKRKPSDCDNVLNNAINLNNTFTVGDGENLNGGARHFRKTKSEMGKENTKKRSSNKRGYRYTCPFCASKMGTIVAFIKHFHTHAETNEANVELQNKYLTEKLRQNTIIKCQICWKSLNQSENLFQHYKQHIAKYKCEFCCKIFNTAHLRKHISVKHTESPQYECTMCNKKLPDADALQSHKNALHCPEKMHSCLVCFTTFDTLEQLKTHCCDHVGHAPYNCQTCTNVFDDAHCLIVHKLKDKCGKFYSCGDCPEIFQIIHYKRTHRVEHH